MSLWGSANTNPKKPTWLRKGAKDGSPEHTFATAAGWTFKRLDGLNNSPFGSVIGQEELIVAVNNLANSLLPAVVTSIEWDQVTIANGATGGVWLTFDVQLALANTNGNATFNLVVNNGTNLSVIPATFSGPSRGANRMKFTFTAPNNANVTAPGTAATLSTNVFANSTIVLRNASANLAANLIANTTNSAGSLAVAVAANLVSVNANTLVFALQANLTNYANVTALLSSANAIALAANTVITNLVANTSNNTPQARDYANSVSVFNNNEANLEPLLATALTPVTISFADSTTISPAGMNVFAALNGSNANLVLAVSVSQSTNGANALVVTL